MSNIVLVVCTLQCLIYDTKIFDNCNVGASEHINCLLSGYWHCI